MRRIMNASLLVGSLFAAARIRAVQIRRPDQAHRRRDGTDSARDPLSGRG